MLRASLLWQFALLAMFSMVGCGGGNGSRSANSGGFDNQTNGLASDADLLELWHNAQARLATAPISLNPVAVLLNGEPNQIVAPDPRAYQINPGYVRVIAVPTYRWRRCPQNGITEPIPIQPESSPSATTWCITAMPVPAVIPSGLPLPW